MMFKWPSLCHSSDNSDKPAERMEQQTVMYPRIKRDSQNSSQFSLICNGGSHNFEQNIKRKQTWHRNQSIKDLVIKIVLWASE